jgi:hypothetical protein
VTLPQQKIFTAEVRADVQVTINNADVIERVTGPGGDEWRSRFYKLYSEGDVIQHLAIVHLNTGERGVNNLDGWADLGPDDADMFIKYADVEDVEEESS